MILLVVRVRLSLNLEGHVVLDVDINKDSGIKRKIFFL